MSDQQLEETEADFRYLSAAWMENQRGGALTGLLIILERCPRTGEPLVVGALDPHDVSRSRVVLERLFRQGSMSRVGIVQPRPSETTEGSQPASPE